MAGAATFGLLLCLVPERRAAAQESDLPLRNGSIHSSLDAATGHRIENFGIGGIVIALSWEPGLESLSGRPGDRQIFHYQVSRRR